MKKTIGVFAHVDAGKTTFSEQVLYHTKSIRSRGRVDHKDAFLDNHNIEKERGITVFSEQGLFEFNNSTYYLVDTPGHIDFSTEMERTIDIIDYAVIVLSAVEGVQGHTKTVYSLLKKHNVPIFFFINKLDRTGADKERVIEEIRKDLTKDVCYLEKDFITEVLEDSVANGYSNINLDDDLIEFISEYDDELLEKYFEGEYDKKLWIETFKILIKENKICPCLGGSALLDEGIVEFINVLDELTFTNYDDKEKILKEVMNKIYKEGNNSDIDEEHMYENKDKFSGVVYKVRHDENGNRVTFIKCLTGELKVRDEVEYKDHIKEKISSIRIYNGNKYKTCDIAKSGELIGVTGLTSAIAGDTLGYFKKSISYEMIPTLMSKVIFDPSYNVKDVYKYFKILEAEDPALNVIWNEALQEMHVHIMGKIQLEVLKEIVEQRFNLKVEFGPCEILYKETINSTVRGCGHFEPLRHYAEVHLKLEPLPRNSGIIFENKCHADDLTTGNQNLIKTHIFEREHHGLLTGSPLTDIKVTLLTGRAHNKHTCGGDFREATYRALRQGLEKAENILLEPYYKFTIKISSDYIGRVLSDIQRLDGTFNPPQTNNEDVTVEGRGPVSTFMDYSQEVIAFSRGKGSITLVYDGYDICHNREEVIEKKNYNKNADIEYTSTSIFCSHGQGYLVEWDKADEAMHCEIL